MIRINNTTIPESVGTTISTREMNGYDDSDFYATYWDGEKPVEVMYATTRGACDDCGAIVDADNAVNIMYNAWLANTIKIRNEINEKHNPIGKTVIAVAGRKFKKGTIAKCLSMRNKASFNPYVKTMFPEKELRVFSSDKTIGCGTSDAKNWKILESDGTLTDINNYTL